MTLQQFKMLDSMQQLRTVWKSVIIAKRSDENFNYELYQIDSFYVEARYWKDEKGLNSLKSFDDTDLLKPYLDQINV